LPGLRPVSCADWSLPLLAEPGHAGALAARSAARTNGDALAHRSIRPPEPPEATLKSREEKRFSRADKDKNGRIEREELFAARRKSFAKLDKNGNGTLSFDEWAVKTIDKFAGADKDRTGWLSPTEYASTAPLRRRKSDVRVNSVLNLTLPG
jgi:hypothetical protein